MLEIVKDMYKSIARMEAMMQDLWDQMIEVLDEQSNVILEIKEQSKVRGSHEIFENQSDVLLASPIILESNKLEDALAIQIAFEDQRVNEVEKIDQREPLVISNKSSLISHIEFVIPNEFKDVKNKALPFKKMIKELVLVSMFRILILQLFKIRGRVFSNWGRRIWFSVDKHLFPCFGILRTRFILKGKGML